MDTATLRVALGAVSYDIVLGADMLADLEGLIAEEVPAHRYAVITDSNVGPVYGPVVTRALGRHHGCSIFEFPAGEKHKCRETWAGLTDQMLSAGFGRDSAVVALGGGVVGDMAGFVAATFLRGVPHVQVPTSLLAMIDSSVGGKTGVDTPYGKNLVGSFHQPSLVVVDVTTLATLPHPHLSAGAAEAVKHGAIVDIEYFDWLIRHREEILGLELESVARMVRRSIEIKATVVSEDEREAGRRAILNFGHTIGHALESESDFALTHGEAIALGMVAEAELGTSAGITKVGTAEALRDASLAFGLPTRAPAQVDAGRVTALTTTDKKSRSGSVRFTLLERIGRVARETSGRWTHAVAESAIRDAVEGVL